MLIVEDYDDARSMYVEYLRMSGFRVAEAANGVDALRRAFELLPDVILMDLALPRLDGWEATRQLKAAGRTRHIPIVALSGHALAPHVEGRAARRLRCRGLEALPARRPGAPDPLDARP